MMRHRRGYALILIFVGFFGIFTPDIAAAYVEFNGFYTSEGLTTASSSTSSRMIFEGSVGFEIDKKGQYLVGWNYSMFSFSDTATDTTTYSSTQMGPRFVYMIDKNKNWSVGLGYYLVTTGAYKAGSGTEEKWKGTALKADFGYNFPVNENFLMGLRINYSSAAYIEKLIGETDYSTVSYQKTAIFPSIYSIYLF